MRQRKNKNLMWLAVLALLYERPMHPYEIAALIKRRLISSSIKLNFGTLYGTINACSPKAISLSREPSGRAICRRERSTN